MGSFKTNDDCTVPKQGKDQTGHLVNEKGYLVTKDGHVCKRNGEVLFKRTTLKAGEIPKFFDFTRFPTQCFQGKFTRNGEGQPQLKPDGNGTYLDDQGRLVSKEGWLMDSSGNIVDQGRFIMFEKLVLGPNSSLPAFFAKKAFEK